MSNEHNWTVITHGIAHNWGTHVVANSETTTEWKKDFFHSILQLLLQDNALCFYSKNKKHNIFIIIHVRCGYFCNIFIIIIFFSFDIAAWEAAQPQTVYIDSAETAASLQ